MKNTLSIDFSGNADLATAFNSMQPGDKFTIEIDCQLNSKDEQGVQCSVEGVTMPSVAEGKAGPEDETGEITPTAEEPVMMAMVARSKSED